MSPIAVNRGRAAAKPGSAYFILFCLFFPEGSGFCPASHIRSRAAAKADAMGCGHIPPLVRYAMRGQCLMLRAGPAAASCTGVCCQVIPAIPEVHRRIVLCDQVGKKVFSRTGRHTKGRYPHGRSVICKRTMGYARITAPGLRRGFWQPRVRCKHARQMSAGRIADQAAAFPSARRTLCVAGDVSPPVQCPPGGAVVVVIRVGVVAHHEHRIAFLVQLVSCGDALL